MVSMATAYWAGLNAAENARLDRQMWDIATRATRRQQAPVDDRAALINQVAQLQAQLQQVIAEREALREHCDANYRAWLAETTSHQRTQAALETVMSIWTPPSLTPHSHPQP